MTSGIRASVDKMVNTSESALLAGDGSKQRREKLRDVMASLEAMEARLAKIELFIADGKDKFEDLDQGMEGLQSGRDELRENMLEVLNTFTSSLQGEFESFKESLLTEVAAIREEVKEVKGDWSLCKMAVTQGAVATRASPRVDVPKPKSYARSRNAREIDNFLWDIEQYFNAMEIVEDDMI